MHAVRGELPRRQLAPDMTVSAIAMGCGRLGAFWQGRSPAAGLDAVAAAREAGIDLFDTADCYARGLSERVLGRALRGQRDAVVICTKVGLLKTPAARVAARRAGGCARAARCFEASYVAWAAERSLRRLRTGHIDVLLLHSPSAQEARARRVVARAGAVAGPRDDSAIRGLLRGRRLGRSRGAATGRRVPGAAVERCAQRRSRRRRRRRTTSRHRDHRQPRPRRRRAGSRRRRDAPARGASRRWPGHRRHRHEPARACRAQRGSGQERLRGQPRSPPQRRAISHDWGAPGRSSADANPAARATSVRNAAS